MPRRSLAFMYEHSVESVRNLRAELGRSLKCFSIISFRDNETAGGTWQSLLSEYMLSSIWLSLSMLAFNSGNSRQKKKRFQCCQAGDEEILEKVSNSWWRSLQTGRIHEWIHNISLSLSTAWGLGVTHLTSRGQQKQEVGLTVVLPDCLRVAAERHSWLFCSRLFNRAYFYCGMLGGYLKLDCRLVF